MKTSYHRTFQERLFLVDAIPSAKQWEIECLISGEYSPPESGDWTTPPCDAEINIYGIEVLSACCTDFAPEYETWGIDGGDKLEWIDKIVNKAFWNGAIDESKLQEEISLLLEGE